MKFCRGDTVINRGHPEFGTGIVLRGKIYDDDLVPVQYINRTGSIHCCDGLGEQGYCWWSRIDILELVKKAKIQLELFEL